MKDWGTDPDKEPNISLLIEAILIGLLVLASYLFAAYAIAKSLTGGLIGSIVARQLASLTRSRSRCIAR